MKIKQEAIGDVYVVRLSGQLMGGPDADAVRETILSALNQGYRNILIDLKDVSWVNSTGLGILMSAHITATQNGGKVKLMRISSRIDSIFMVTRLNTVFQVFDKEDEALASFEGETSEGQKS